MNRVLPLLVFLLAMGIGNAQTALYNAGTLQIHDQGQLGIHTDWINAAPITAPTGLVGFYGDRTLRVSGSVVPTFYDVEIATDYGVSLQLGIETEGHSNFILGDFRTPRTSPGIQYTLLFEADYSGESDFSKIDGYAAVTDQQNIVFPVGDALQLRALIMRSVGVNASARCAYFREDPNFPNSFPTGFDTGEKPRDLGDISTHEFWRVEGSVASTIEISWNAESQVDAFAETVADIVPVGWSKATGRWERLGNGTATGDMAQGFVVTGSLVPDDYEIITLAGMGVPSDQLDLGNYMVTPNGDGINDALEIPELVDSPHNSVYIFDRYGVKVFEQENYVNEFRGFANTGRWIINQEAGLPAGVYFYVAKLYDLDMEFQGYLYLAQE